MTVFSHRFNDQREAAWRGLGPTFEGRKNATDAMHEAGLDYSLHKAPLYVQIDGQLVEYKGRQAVMREPIPSDPQWRTVGDVGREYGLVQNEDIARRLDTFTKDWPVETVGQLNHGEIVFYALRADQFDIMGDELQYYYVISDNRSGKRSLNIMLTPLRFTCANTLPMAAKKSIINVGLYHGSNIHEELDFFMGLKGRMKTRAQETKEQFEFLAGKKIDNEQLMQIVETAYPNPTVPRLVQTMDGEKRMPERIKALVDRAQAQHEYALERVDEFRKAAISRYHAFDNPYLAGTAWAAVQGVVEVEDYRRDRGTATAKQSALFGERAKIKTRAFEEAIRV